MSNKNSTKQEVTKSTYIIDKNIRNNYIGIYQSINGKKSKVINNCEDYRFYANKTKVHEILNFFLMEYGFNDETHRYLYYYDESLILPNLEVKKNFCKDPTLFVSDFFTSKIENTFFLDIFPKNLDDNIDSDNINNFNDLKTKTKYRQKSQNNDKKNNNELYTTNNPQNEKRSSSPKTKSINDNYKKDDIIDNVGSISKNLISKIRYENDDLYRLTNTINIRNESTNKSIEGFNEYTKAIQTYEDLVFSKDNKNDNFLSLFSKDKKYSDLTKYNFKSKNRPLFPFYHSLKMGNCETHYIKFSENYKRLTEYLKITLEDMVPGKVACDHLIILLDSNNDVEFKNHDKPTYKTNKIRELTMVIKNKASLLLANNLFFNYLNYEIDKLNLLFDFNASEYLSFDSIFLLLNKFSCNSLSLSLKGVFEVNSTPTNQSIFNTSFLNESITYKQHKIVALEINDYGCTLQNGYLEKFIRNLFEGSKSKEIISQNYNRVNQLILENFHIYNQTTLVIFFAVIFRFKSLSTIKLKSIIPYQHKYNGLPIPKIISHSIKTKILNKIQNIEIIDSPILDMSNFECNIIENNEHNKNKDFNPISKNIDLMHLNFHGRNVTIQNSIIYEQQFLDIYKNDQQNKFKISLTDSIFNIIEDNDVKLKNQSVNDYNNKCDSDKQAQSIFSRVNEFNIQNITNNVTDLSLQSFPITDYIFERTNELIKRIITRYNLFKVKSLTLDRCEFISDFKDVEGVNNNNSAINLNKLDNRVDEQEEEKSSDLFNIFGSLRKITLINNSLISLNFLNNPNKLEELKLDDQDICISTDDGIINYEYNKLKTLWISVTSTTKFPKITDLSNKINFNSIEKIVLEKKAWLMYKDFYSQQIYKTTEQLLKNGKKDSNENIFSIYDLTLKNFDYQTTPLSTNETNLKEKENLSKFLKDNTKFTIFRIINSQFLLTTIISDINNVVIKENLSETDVHINWPRFKEKLIEKYGEFNTKSLDNIIQEIFLGIGVNQSNREIKHLRDIFIYNRTTEKEIEEIFETLRGWYKDYKIIIKKF